MQRVVIVGGGVTGLTTALEVRQAAAAAGIPVEVVVLEENDAPGGNIRTERVDGYTIENGPNGFLDNAPRTLELVRRIGLDGAMRHADEAAAVRYIYHDGTLHEVPTGPGSFLRSPLLSLRGRLRVLAEPFARHRPQHDETVHDFAARRIGPEAASVLVDAMVSGVFAGDVRALSLRSSFPKMAAMEAEHGGLVKAMVARMRAGQGARDGAGPAGPGGTLTSFEGGMDTLIRGLVAALDADRAGPHAVRTGPHAVRTGARATAIERAPGDAAWRVRLGSGEELAADAVVLTIPSPRAAPLIEPTDAALAEAVGAIPTAGLSVVALAYDASAIPPVNGFGFLVPRGEDLRILGCLWDSSVFPGRAPRGKVLLRAMIGGAHDPGAVTEADHVLIDRVRRDLREAMEIDAEPELTRVYRWPLGIGQYHVGHQDRLDRIHQRLDESPGLWLAGSSYYGVSINACVEKAAEQGPEIVRALGSARTPRYS